MRQSDAWATLYRDVMRGAAAHRRTGIGRADARRKGAPALPLPRWVSPECAHDGLATAAIGLSAEELARPEPSDEARQRLSGLTRAYQSACAHRPGLAVSGCYAGEGRTLAEEAAQDAVSRDAEPGAELEAEEERAAILGQLTAEERLDASCMRGDSPWPSGWTDAQRWKRAQRVRDRIRAIILAREGF